MRPARAKFPRPKPANSHWRAKCSDEAVGAQLVFLV